MTVADFILDRMSRYIAGGLTHEKAAHFTRGELLAIYNGNHYSKNADGKPVKTPPPETLDTETAMTKADAVLSELLNNHAAPISAAETERITETTQRPAADKITMLPKSPPPMQSREGQAALEYMTQKGIALIGAYKTGATIASGEARAAAFTTDMATINGLREGTDSRTRGIINRFYFLPCRAGLLCLDIDRKNGKDGIAEFYSFCEKAGKPRHLLPGILQDIPARFPCYVSTPSNGIHLYFSYRGAAIQKKPLAPNTPAVELKHGEPGLTAPGSYKNDKPYILHGELENAPPLPAFILDAIEPPKKPAAAYMPNSPGKKEWGKPSWDKIMEWTETDGAGAGRNDRAFNLARHARNHDYSEAETLDALRREPSLDGLPEKEIETAVHSAYKGQRT